MKHLPITYRRACDFIVGLHRHHGPPQGCKFCLGAFVDGRMVAVAIAGRPVARNADNGVTAEITRLCSDGTPNACSFLYGRMRRVCQAMGYEKVLTSILKDEPGTSLIAAGFELSHETDGGSWNRASRARTDKHPTCAKKVYVSRIGGAA